LLPFTLSLIIILSMIHIDKNRFFPFFNSYL
jgi:hypothetical protein